MDFGVTALGAWLRRNLVAFCVIAATVLSLKKKPTWWNTPKGFDHVGLLVRGPPGPAGLPSF